MKLFQFRLRGKMTLFFSLLLLLFGITILIFVQNGVNELNNYNMEKQLKSIVDLEYKLFSHEFEGSWSLKDGSLYKGDILLEESSDAVDTISSATRYSVALFSNEKIAATSLSDTNISSTALKTLEDKKKM